MNETLDLNDMNITLDSFGALASVKGFFGSAPIRAEGEPVEYDQEEREQDTHSFEVDAQIDGAEVVDE